MARPVAVSLACSVAIVMCGVALFNWWATSGLPILSQQWHYQVSNRFPLAALALVGGIVFIRLLTWGQRRSQLPTILILPVPMVVLCLFWMLAIEPERGGIFLLGAAILAHLLTSGETQPLLRPVLMVLLLLGLIVSLWTQFPAPEESGALFVLAMLILWAVAGWWRKASSNQTDTTSGDTPVTEVASEGPSPSLRRHQFSLRTLLLCFPVAATVMACWFSRELLPFEQYPRGRDSVITTSRFEIVVQGAGNACGSVTGPLQIGGLGRTHGHHLSMVSSEPVLEETSSYFWGTLAFDINGARFSLRDHGRELIVDGRSYRIQDRAAIVIDEQGGITLEERPSD